MDRRAMKFGSHYPPTYVPDLDGPLPEFYRHMFAQMEEMDRLGYDQVWLTEHHFAMYGGIPHELALKNIRLFADRAMPEFKSPRTAVTAVQWFKSFNACRASTRGEHIQQHCCYSL